MAIDQEMIAQKTTINPKNLNLFMNFSSSYTNRFRRLGGKKAQHIQGSHLSGYQTDPCVCEFDSLQQKRVLVVYAITDESGCYRFDRPPRSPKADRPIDPRIDPASPIGI
jgi:hypothetical protein